VTCGVSEGVSARPGRIVSKVGGEKESREGGHLQLPFMIVKVYTVDFNFIQVRSIDSHLTNTSSHTSCTRWRNGPPHACTCPWGQFLVGHLLVHVSLRRSNVLQLFVRLALLVVKVGHGGRLAK